MGRLKAGFDGLLSPSYLNIPSGFTLEVLEVWGLTLLTGGVSFTTIVNHSKDPSKPKGIQELGPAHPLLTVPPPVTCLDDGWLSGRGRRREGDTSSQLHVEGQGCRTLLKIWEPSWRGKKQNKTKRITYKFPEVMMDFQKPHKETFMSCQMGGNWAEELACCRLQWILNFFFLLSQKWGSWKTTGALEWTVRLTNSWRAP